RRARTCCSSMARRTRPPACAGACPTCAPCRWDRSTPGVSSPGWRATLRPPVSSSTATPPAVPAAVAAASTGRGCPPRRHGHGCWPADARPARWPKPCAACAPGAWTWRAASSPRPASRIPIACTDSSWRYGVPTPAMPIDFSRYPDEHGHFGRFGGSFVAETLVAPLAELRDAYLRYRVDPELVAELER